MRVRARGPMKIRGKGGIVEIKEGDRFSLQDEAALSLVEQGKVEMVGMVPSKIFSRLLGETIMLVESTGAMDYLISRGTTEVVYLPSEIAYLSDKDPQTIRTSHDIKKTFLGSIVGGGG